jgi:hypothetical protein
MIDNHFAAKKGQQWCHATQVPPTWHVRALPAIGSKHQMSSSIVHVHFLLQERAQQFARLSALVCDQASGY